MAKKKLDELTKGKLMYSGELIVFSVIFIVLGILFGIGVIGVSDWKRWVFPIVTFAGGIWAIVDFIWTLKSPKKRANNSLLDKILALPSAIGLLCVDTYIFIIGITTVDEMVYRIAILIVFSYLSAVYLFEGIYHYYKPTPALLKAIAEDAKKKEEEE